ncbi:SRPBCC family protein [Nocardioides sp. URHA0020]|uniref:SRPBCC family protein n=1 Tax=Nocardioides sp. URHA0020 TaxID=1380392 RepID=UPI0006881A32|nr:SRPBCC family protein [Nocardioides sp. URHA0020]
MTIELGRGRTSSTAHPDAFFARWIDHDSWPQWSPDTEWVRVEGPVRTGTRGRLKPAGGPAVRFTVSACEPGREYTDTTRLPGATLVFQHTAEPTEAGTELGVLVTMSGPLAWLWSRIMGGGFRESAQADLDRLVALVEAEAEAEAAVGRG